MQEEDTDASKATELKTDKQFCSYFRSLDQGRSDVVRFFDRKTFFSAHGRDALLIADVFFRSRHAVRVWDKTAGGLPLEYVAVRANIEFPSVVKMLLVEQKIRVEVFSSTGSGRWELTKRASPGNVESFDEVVDSVSKDPPVAVSAVVGPSSVGIAFAETTMLTMGVMEFADDDQMTNFECALLQLGARECFMVEGLAEKDRRAAKANRILEKCGIPVTPCKRADFTRKDIEQDLTTLLGSVKQNLPELDQKLAMEALACIIKKLELLQVAGGKRFKLQRVDLARYMKLDFAALRALNLVPGIGEGASSVNLYNLLDSCKTPMGSRRLLRWIKQPLVDVSEIEKRQNLVEALAKGTELRQTLREECLRCFADLDRLSKKLSGEKATLQDTVVLYSNAEKLKPVLRVISEYEGPRSQDLKSAYAGQLTYQVEKLKKFQSMIEQLVDLDKAEKEHLYEINTTWDERLAKLDAGRRRVRDKIDKLALQAATDLGVKQVKVKEGTQWGFVLHVTKGDEKKLREQGRRYTPLDGKGAGSKSASTGVRFTCRDLEDLNASFKSQTEEYEEITKETVAKVLEVSKSYLALIEGASDVIADIDVLADLAHVSASRNYVRPVVSAPGVGDTVLLDSRHPCVEAAGTGADAGAAVVAAAGAGAGAGGFIPNDVSLIRGKSQFVIITGPNMGGKSTYIRQIGVTTVMAQMGCFVPAREAHVSAADCILCRVGAGDSQLRGVSTFMAEMLETAAILKTATPRSLVIVDELGRGTSTYDGFGLAWAISEHICRNIGCFCLFATHFHELTALEAKVPFAKNLHVTAQTLAGRLVLQYKVNEGPCDRSFGIHVAELADFPQTVIEVARRKAAELEDFRPRKRQEMDPDSAAATPEPELTGEDRRAKEEIEVFLAEFGAIPMEKMTDEEAMAKAKEITLSFLKRASPAARKVLNIDEPK